MNMQNVLNKFLGSQDNTRAQGLSADTLKNTARNVSNKFGSFGTGAAIGGVAALLLGSKKARRFAGSAAKVGGAAVIGGLAFQAFKNWQQSKVLDNSNMTDAPDVADKLLAHPESAFEDEVTTDKDFQLTLIKAMIAAAKADGHIDDVEQHRIFSVIESMPQEHDFKYMIMDLLRKPTSILELVEKAMSFEQRTEVYLVSCFAIDVDNEAEHQYLKQLGTALCLPNDLTLELQNQARQAVLQAA
ncbi:tellurite resistance TerB family protein [Bermanella sp. R86510]|uniref:tellurite resistance TerB family protein n=1 Tax=unclassified Bermanella TaxID=2627862 RepID=UPI0037CC6572